MRRTIINLLLLVAVGGLGLWLWLDRPAEAPKQPLVTEDSDSLSRAGFRLSDGTEVALERDADGSWWLSQPVVAPADPLEVNSLLSVARAEAGEPIAVAEVELANLGLDAPERSIFFDDTRLEFGAINPVTLQRYVRRGAHIFQIDDPAGAPQNVDHSNFVAKEVVPPGRRLQAVETPDWSLEKDAEGNWTIHGRDDVPDGAAAEVGKAWAEARAMWTRYFDPGSGNNGAPKGTPVTLVLDDDSRVRLHGRRDQQLVLTRADYRVAYHLRRDLTELLLDARTNEDSEDAEATGQGEADAGLPEEAGVGQAGGEPSAAQ